MNVAYYMIALPRTNPPHCLAVLCDECHATNDETDGQVGVACAITAPETCDRCARTITPTPQRKRSAAEITCRLPGFHKMAAW